MSYSNITVSYFENSSLQHIYFFIVLGTRLKLQSRIFYCYNKTLLSGRYMSQIIQSLANLEFKCLWPSL